MIAKGDPDTGVSDGFAPGIGGGRAGDYITITGGEVTALGGQYAPGIEGDHTVISGGTVYSIGLKGGAGIGSRVDYNCGTVTISGSAIVHAAGGLAGTDNSSHTFGNGASIGEGGQYSPSTADGTPLDLDTVAAGLYTTGAIYCYPTGTTLDQIKNNSVSPSTTRAGTVEFYSVDVTYGAHGTASADVTSGLQGNLVTLTAVPETGYMFKEWQVVSGGVTLANVNDAVTTFSIGTANVSVRAIFEDPSPAPYYPPSSPSEPEPQFGNSQGWSSITNQINNMEPGSNVTVDMNGTTTLPSNVLNAIQGKDVNLVLDMGSGVKWKINGSDVTASTGNLNMAVKVGTSSIPVDVINNLTKERYSIQIELANKGAFGFNAVLTVPIRTQDAGLFANLFRFVKRGASVAEIRAAGDKTDSEEGTFEFVSVGQIAADGSVDLLFDGAATTRDSSGSVYAIVIDNKSLDPNEKSTPTTDSSKIELKATSKQKRITFTWNKVNGAKKYRIFQKVAGVYLPVKTIKASKPAKATVSKALTKIKKNGKTDYEIKTLIVGKKYTFAVCAYVNSKWSEITKTSRVTVKVRK